MKETRVVETAIDKRGKSYIFSDQKVKGWKLPGHTITDLSYSSVSPPNMLRASESPQDKNFNLKPGEIRFFRSDIEPTKAVYNSLTKDEKPKERERLFYHSTTTVDYILVVKGELVLLVEDEKVCLGEGDAIVQRGAAHAWHNETDEVASIAGVMVGVELPSQFKRVDTVQPD